MKLIAEYETSGNHAPYKLDFDFYCRDELIGDIAQDLAGRSDILPNRERTFQLYHASSKEYDISFYKEWLGETNKDFGVLASPYLLRAVIGVAARSNAEYKPLIRALRRADEEGVRLVEDIQLAWRTDYLPGYNPYGWMGLQPLIKKQKPPSWMINPDGGMLGYPTPSEAIEAFPPAQFL